MIYDVDYFIDFFTKIPSRKIINGRQTDYKGNHCVYGWCSPNAGEINAGGFRGGDNTEMGIALRKVLQPLYPLTHVDRRDDYVNPAQINNGNYKEYKQRTPKQRILAALHDIKKLNQGIETSTERRNEVQSELQRADITKKLSQIEIVSETSDLLTRPVSTVDRIKV